MKILALLFFVVSLQAVSQQTLDAQTILQDLKEGKSVALRNTIIRGDLDLTYMQEAIQKLPKKFKWIAMEDNTIEKQITAKLSFENCTFENDVLAYIHDEDSKYTFVANFEDDVIFNNCTFKGKAMFKYSDFEEITDFRGAQFLDDSTFKYASFSSDISFYNTFFKDVATFKYAKFKKFVSFANTVFKDEVVFKYTEFKNGLSLNNVKFEDDLDIKYLDVSGDFNITNMTIAGSVDAKYASINGKDFSSYLVKK